MTCIRKFSWKLAVRAFLIVVGLDVIIIILGNGSWLFELAWWIVNFSSFPLFNILLPRMAGWSLVLAIGGGLFSAIIWSVLAGYFFRRKHILKIIISMPLVLIVVYIGTFLCCWFLSPSSVSMQRNKRVHDVSFQTGTNIKIWLPAFWFVKHVYGYENYQSAGGVESSIFVFTKYLDSPDTETSHKP